MHDGISIHAAREGGDAAGKLILMHDGISIHAAREGGDDGALMTVVQRGISIHAAREGGDHYYRQYFCSARDFNPRRP